MADTLTNQTIDALAQYVLGKNPTEPTIQLGLYTNSVSWSYATVLADLTECTAPGYARVTLTPASWTGSTSSGAASYAYPAVVFTLTGQGSPAQTVEGWFFHNSVALALMWGANAASAWAIPAGGGTYSVTPTWSDRQC